MNITITGRHMEMTEALKVYIESGLDKLKSHFDRVIDADVVLDVQKHRHIAEVNLHANGLRIHGREASSDMYASVDAVMEKLGKQIRKYKGRINRHKPRKMQQARDYHHAIIALQASGEVGLGNGDNAVGEVCHAHQIIKREKHSMRPMSIEEAVMQLELIDDHPFLVFANVDTSQVNVLYKREDGTHGLIEPQF